MALYLKYRPKNFSDLYGQKHVRITLQKAIELDRMAHAYIFCGPRGTGKTTTARLIAKSLNCLKFDDKKNEPCNKCEICNEINQGSLVDVIEIDAASNRGIDEIRELRESVKFAAYKAKNKVYIIDEVHMLTNEAFNALLKTLEEPPNNVYFILATTEVHKIPDTIISRCQRFDFREISDEDILARLKIISDTEEFKFDKNVLKLIVKKARGGMRDAISLLDKISASGLKNIESISKILGVTPEDVLEDLFEKIVAGDTVRATEIVVNLTNTGYGSKQIAIDVFSLLRDKLQIAVFNDDQAKQSRYVFLMEAWQKVWEVFKNSLMPEAALEIFVVKASAYFAGVNIEVPTPIKVAIDKDEKIIIKNGAKNTVESLSSDEIEANIETIVKNKLDVEVIEKETKAETPKKPQIDSQLADVLASDEVPIPNIRKRQAKSNSKKVIGTKLDKLNITSISLEKLKKVWQQTLDRVESQVLKRTLQAVNISKDTEKVFLKVNSNFHFEQIIKSDSRLLVEELFFDELQGKVDLEIQVDTSLAPDLNRSADLRNIKKFNAFELNPNTGKPNSLIAESEPVQGNGISAKDIANFFG